MKVWLMSVQSDYPVGLRYIASFLENHGHEVFFVKMENPSRSGILSLLKRDRPDVIGLSCYTADIWKVLNMLPFIKFHAPRTKIV